MTRSLPATALAGLVGGALVALSLPPWGWWPLAVVGFGVLGALLDGRSPKGRALIGLAFGLGQFGLGLAWMREFTLPGTVLAVLLESALVAGAATATPRRHLIVLPAALTVAEAIRGAVPFGGLPLAGAALGQVGGPFVHPARLGGGLLVVFAVAALGVGLVLTLVRPRTRRGAVALVGAALLLTIAGAIGPDGGTSVRSIEAVAVQGGGRRGFRAIDTDPGDVYLRHLEATESVPPGRDLVLWPEDVVDVRAPLAERSEGAELAALARALDATLVVGIVEDIGADTFTNAAVAWSGTGVIVDRYEKVHRVPFGEYVPFRGLVSRLADVSAVPRDARPGRGPGLLRTPAGRLGTLISYEVFFSDRGRAATRAGAELLLVPTNAASFTDSQVPTQQVAAARLRAVETGRDVLQAGPTGYTAAVDHRGLVLARSVLGRQQNIAVTLSARTGQTLYSTVGDGPVLGGALVFLAASAVMTVRRRRRPDRAPVRSAGERPERVEAPDQ